MYEELVKSIHCCFGFEEPAVTDCENCMMKDKREEHNYVGCCDALGLAAAEAIEELLAERDEVNAGSWKTAFEVERDEHRWIPVTERLPEKTNHYLVHVKCGCDGKFASAWEQVAWFCEKFYWEHQHGDDVFKETITHWMPLPEPPKEE